MAYANFDFKFYGNQSLINRIFLQNENPLKFGAEQLEILFLVRCCYFNSTSN